MRRQVNDSDVGLLQCSVRRVCAMSEILCIISRIVCWNFPNATKRLKATGTFMFSYRPEP